MPCSCDHKGMWDRRVSIGQTLNENSGLSTLEPLMELIIEHCTGKCNHSISNEMVRLTASEALESIPEKVDHSHRWHKEESSNNSFSTITEKLKILNHDMSDLSNALADLGASISVMPFSMFKCLGLGNPRPVNMVIEMTDRSMQSPKGIVENVLVKIHKFIFLVDFVILNIVEDNKVPIILGGPMLATAHARIDVFRGKISLEVEKE
ncbi:retrovirus-related pol polyprotein from transposon TNT 1-94 [Tanacetum coccineum]